MRELKQNTILEIVKRERAKAFFQIVINFVPKLSIKQISSMIKKFNFALCLSVGEVVQAPG